MSFQIVDGNGNWIGDKLYTEAKFAVAAAKRSAKARFKAATTIGAGVVYIVENDGSIYGKRIATVTSSEVAYRK